MKSKTRFLLSCLTAFFFYLAGVFVEAAFKCGSAMLVPVIVANSIPIVCFFVNLAVGKSYAKAMNKASVAEMSGYLHSHRDAAAETAESKLSLLCTLRRLSRISHCSALCVDCPESTVRLFLFAPRRSQSVQAPQKL